VVPVDTCTVVIKVDDQWSHICGRDVIPHVVPVDTLVKKVDDQIEPYLWQS